MISADETLTLKITYGDGAYTVVCEWQNGGFVTEGDSIPHALEMAADAARELLAGDALKV